MPSDRKNKLILFSLIILSIIFLFGLSKVQTINTALEFFLMFFAVCIVIPFIFFTLVGSIIELAEWSKLPANKFLRMMWSGKHKKVLIFLLVLFLILFWSNILYFLTDLIRYGVPQAFNKAVDQNSFW